jgi:pimeloyl-ACP methyl ester carboxylesterase
MQGTPKCRRCNSSGIYVPPSTDRPADPGFGARHHRRLFEAPISRLRLKGEPGLWYMGVLLLPLILNFELNLAHRLEITMASDSPFVREAGSGPGIVCIHSNASSSAQWRGLMDLLSRKHLVLAPDCYGSGKSSDWYSDREITLRDEVDFIEPVFARAGTPFALVGHSYGAAIALMAALLNPGRVRALALYEPSLFAVVDAQRPPPNGADGIRNAALAAAEALDAGDREAAAGHFIDFWMGSGSWDATPLQRKPAIANAVANVRRWSHALFGEPTPVQAFAALDMPVLYMLGESSPEPVHAVARVLLPVLPRVQVVEFPGLGHMAPVTHPEAINAAVAKFFSEA